MICVGGLIYYWVCESILVGEQVLVGVGDDVMLMFFLQVEEECVVDNCMYDCFCEFCIVVGYFVEGGWLLVIKGVYYEIFFEKDVMCLVVFYVIVDFFNRYNLFSGNCFIEV